jgi:uncharacterized membrane protein YhaH (DUF805 family)
VLAKLFSFRGQLTRLEFLGWSVAATLLLVVITVILMAASVIGAKELRAGVGAGMLGLIIALVMAVAYLWCGLALAAKRIRDIGLSPLIVMTSLFLFDIVDVLMLTRLIHARFFWPLDQYTIIGGAVNLAYLGALLLWPSQDADASPAEPSARTAPSAPRPSMPSPTARTPRREFGLRTR